MDRRGRQCHSAKTIINDEGVGCVLSLHLPSFRIKGHPLSSHSIYAILETNTQERRKLSCIGIKMIFTPFIASATA